MLPEVVIGFPGEAPTTVVVYWPENEPPLLSSDNVIVIVVVRLEFRDPSAFTFKLSN
jgi:hypothetical protein